MTDDETPRTRRSLRCTLGFHRWHGKRRANGEHYSVCRRCGRVEVDTFADDFTRGRDVW